MIYNNIWQARAAIKQAQNKIDVGARMARDEMMARLIQLAKEQIQGERGLVGHKIRWVDGQAKKGAKIYNYEDDPAVPGQPPKNRTGNLRRSIRGEKFRLGFASYGALVGPTIVYGRRVELGGGNWPEGVRFPYMKPAFEQYRKEHYLILRKYLTLRG